MKNKLIDTANIVWTWAQLPAFFYHELCHVLMILIVYPWVTNIDIRNSYLRIYMNKDKSMGVDCTINIDMHPVAGILIGTAPIIGWFIGYMLLLNIYPIADIYFGAAFKMFNMSKQDVLATKECFEDWKKIRREHYAKKNLQRRGM